MPKKIKILDYPIIGSTCIATLDKLNYYILNDGDILDFDYIKKNYKYEVIEE